jgi:predicted glutamine amidotransferase
MSRLFGCMCNEPERLRCVLYPARESLVAPTAPEGWGLAFFQGGEVLLQRHPKPVKGPLDFHVALRELKTDYVIGHVREPGTQPTNENTQPYRFRAWVFAHSGSIDRFDAIQAGVLEHVPGFLKRNIRGESDSELLFHLFLSFLHDAGKLDDSNLNVADAVHALRATLSMVDRLVKAAGGSMSGEQSSLNLIMANGRIMLAVRRGPSMWVRKTNGLADCAVCREQNPAEPASDRRRFSHEHLRSVLVVSEPTKLGPEGWEEVPDGALVGISRDLQLSIHGLAAA